MLIEFLHYQLCYVKYGVAHFANVSPTEVWGDDWNDAPYEHNAGSPYVRPEAYKLIEVHYWHVAYETPADRANGNSWVSVDDINGGNCAWLFANDSEKYPPIMAGATLAEFIQAMEPDGEIYVPLSWLVI